MPPLLREWGLMHLGVSLTEQGLPAPTAEELSWLLAIENTVNEYHAEKKTEKGRT